MKRFWEELDEKDLELLEESLEPDMKYEGSQGIQNRFEAKCKDMDGKKGGKVAMMHKKKKKSKFVLVLAAVLVLMCGIGVAASYGTWHLTDPGTYEGDPLKFHGTSSYVWDEKKQAYVNENGEVENGEAENDATGSRNTEADQRETGSVKEKLSDEYFLEKTQKILEIIGKRKIDLSKMQVTYQKDEDWNREEVMISFPLSQEDSYSGITFIRETGDFLGATVWGNENEADGPLMSDSEALEAARGWYEKLPYPQGYVYTHVSKYDDHCWMYSFCHEVDVEIDGKKITMSNAYEEARIGIDPTNGQLTLCNSFNVPLLDDHKEGDKPLTEAQARKIADQVIADSEERNVTAELGIVHPHYEMASGLSVREDLEEKNGDETNADGTVTEEAFVTNHRFDQVTRLAWTITYEKPNETFADIIYVSVDLYTGEILAYDMTL